MLPARRSAITAREPAGSVQAEFFPQLRQRGAKRAAPRRLWLWVLALLLAVPACAQQDSGVIEGRVTDSRGHEQRVMVDLLAAGDIPAGNVYTDGNGQYTFFGLPSGDYWLVIEAKDFQPVRQHIRLDTHIDPKLQVNIPLEAVIKQPAAPTPVIVGGASSHKLDAATPAPKVDPRALREFDKGNAQQQKGDLQGAISHYEKALRIDAQCYPALNNLGAVYERQGDHRRAETLLGKAIEIDPSDGESYVNLGHVLYEEGHYQEAAARLKEGLARSPGSATGHFFLGSTFMKLGDLAQAESDLKTSVALDPRGMASAHLQLANLYLKRHDMSAAGVELQAYLEARPSDPQAPAIKKMLAQISASRTN